MMKWLTGILAIALIGFGVHASAFSDDEDIIEYRQYIMKTLGDQAAIVSMILQERAPPDDFATHLEILANAASTAKKAFEPEAQGGDAKPEVWEQWQDFSERMDKLAAATRTLADAARTGGIAEAGPMVRETFTCKSCHDTYRQPK
jgi:cytochrome c556